MVRLTIDLIARGTSVYTKKKREESTPTYLKRLTHLHLEDRKIDEIGDELALCKNLSVLYLYDNDIERIPNLLQNMNLTHLYLQNNNISRIEALGHLNKLSKLYIGGNKLSLIEGLEQLTGLQELHVEHQQLPAGEQLLFDPRTLNTLSRCVQVLNISGNHITSIRDLEGLHCILQFFCADNRLDDLKELTHVLGSWHMLTRLDLAGNPLTDRSKYRDRVIVMCRALENLDGKAVSHTSRTFLQKWKASKDASTKNRKLSRQRTDLVTYGDDKDRVDLPSLHAHASAPSSGAPSSYMMPGLRRKQFDEILARSVSLQFQPESTTLTRKLSEPAGRSLLGEFPDYGLVLKLKQRIQNFPSHALE